MPRTITIAGATLAVASLLSACGQFPDSGDAETSALPEPETSVATSAIATANDQTSEKPTSAESPQDEKSNGGDTGASTSEKPRQIVGAGARANFSKEQVRVTQPDPADLRLKDVRAGRHDAYDRVVFEYEGSGTPSYLAGYVETPQQQASGNYLQIPGNAHLEVIIQGTAGDMLRTNEAITQIGSKGVAAGNVVDVNLASIFEADSQFFIGMDSQRGFNIFTLENPTRVVVDVAR